MTYTISRAKIVLLNKFFTVLWTLWNRIYLLGYFSFRGWVVFNGRVYVESCGGVVIVGAGVKFGHSVQISAARDATISIGERSTINFGSVLVARSSIKIGNDVMAGEYLSIRDNDHEYSMAGIPMRNQGYSVADIVIEDDVWIGRCVTICKGVVIGKGSVIAANSVVTKSVQAFSIVAGVPAKIIKMRNNV